ncbi:hypothetical protein GGTG_03621 [Gaeumannomyces tritici R3-111a-1]|uniref:Zn(2)-C6 fungal-type domain-containing protein n=1 Tax=Gaeumannomyces tritici (strain R3-111a-1) TaxID=644352 RepID=J3NQR5_GAET3|nr:hypothetical protein GGTG_03621 [Gaeumannomyces tritici R3-111a-1]EJT78521.1 hypothetical protein GGTG_03621 [Gaeumannomyces tritici R3-111a-1]
MEAGDDDARPASEEAGDGGSSHADIAAATETPTAGDGPPPTKRRKTRLACQECRDRKVRCDGARPVCGACFRKRLSPEQCIFVDVSDQQTAEISPLYVRSLEERIQELERAARGLDGPTPLPYHFGGSNHHPPHQASPRQTCTVRHYDGAPLANNASTPVPIGAGAGHVVVASPIDQHMAASQLIHMQRLGRQEPTSNGNGPAPGREGLGSPEPGSAMGATESTPTESDRAVFLGRSSAAAFVREVRESSRRHGGMSSIASEDANGASPSEGGTSVPYGAAAPRERRRLKRDREALEALMDELILPPRWVADTHLNKYWESIHPLFPVLHKGSFMGWYERIWGDQESSGDDTVHTIRTAHARLNIMLALGCSAGSKLEPGPSSKRSAHIFYERSRALLTQSSVDHGCSMQLVQAHILTAQYLQTTDLVNGCWVAIGTAIRAAQGIGVSEDHPRESQVAREERRRTWWGCIMMDRVASMILGRPSMVAWKTVVPLPLPVDDELLQTTPGSGSIQPNISPARKSRLEFYVYTLHLTEILMTVLEQFYVPHIDLRRAGPEGINIQDLQRLHEIDFSLSRWRASLPIHLRVYSSDRYNGGASAESGSPFAKQAVTLHGRYLHLRILLFRPTTVDLSSGAFLQADAAGKATEFQRGVVKACVSSCVSAARELITLVWNGIDEGKDARATLPWWYAIFYLYTAGTVVLAVLLTPNLRLVFCHLEAAPGAPGAHGDPEGNPESLLQASWSTCVKALSLYQQSGSTFARRCLWILRAIYDQRSTQCDVAADRSPEIAATVPETDAAAAEASTHPLPSAMVTRPSARANGSGTITPTTWQALANAAFEGSGALGPAAGHHTGTAADDFLLDLCWPAGNMDWLHNQPGGFDQGPARVDGVTDGDTAML